MQDIISEQEFAKAIGTDRVRVPGFNALLMAATKITRFNHEFRRVSHLKGMEFIDTVLDHLGVRVSTEEGELKNIPAKGPFVVVANHPYGGVEGLILLSLICAVRPDTKLMANFLLRKIPNMADYLIAVNPFDHVSNASSISGVRKVLHLLDKGHPVIIFPAGEVSAYQPALQQITDRRWHPVVGKLIARAGVPVVPVYVQGNNSLLFNLMGLVHPALRTARLPAELFNKDKHTIPIRIGKPLKFADLPYVPYHPEKLLHYLRARTYTLATSLKPSKKRSIPIFAFRLAKQPKPIDPPLPATLLLTEIATISAYKVFSSSNFDVYITPAQVIPAILKEIGRLREETFRSVGEGTNKANDLDLFDVYYQHLFIWDRTHSCVVGAYRIGRGDELFYAMGKKGFYVEQLFKIGKPLYPVLQQSLELGRSWVRKEYQQQPLPLYLLWKSIAAYLKKNPQYRYLIGPVSISNNFSRLSKSLMVEYIRRYHYDDELAMAVRPRKRFTPDFAKIERDILLPDNISLKFFDRLISDTERFGMKFPVLLRHYLGLNAKIIGFNVDPKFCDSLDGLMVLKLEGLPPDVFEKMER